MSEDILLAIDHGTQSVRALLFDTRGRLLAKSQVKLGEYRQPQPGWMEHDPEAFWRSLCQACRQLWAVTPIRPQQLRGLAVTTQRGTVINLDAKGRPLRPAITWADQRRCDAKARYGWRWQAAFRALGLRETVRFFEQEAEAGWIAQHQPDLWARTDKFVLLSGYLHHRLTGEYIDAVGSQVGYVPFDFRKGAWAAPGDWKWSCVPVKPGMLPTLVPSGSVSGKISAAAAAETGLPPGLTVIAGAADKACEVLGSGCLMPDTACLSYGTTATVNTNTSRYVEAVRFVPPFPSAVPGQYNTEVQVTRGYWLVSWFAEQFGLREQELAKVAGGIPEHFFDELLESVPPGSDGLVLQPEARGAIIGFSPVHTRAHLYRAIIEGLAYALRDGKERIERRAGQPVTLLRVAGGGSQSDAAMQITADVFNLPAERSAVYEASGLGAAILASVGLGLHDGFDTAVKNMTRVGRRFEPVAGNSRLYERLYREVYSHMYGGLRPLYRRLRDIVDERAAG